MAVGVCHVDRVNIIIGIVVDLHYFPIKWCIEGNFFNNNRVIIITSPGNRPFSSGKNNALNWSN